MAEPRPPIVAVMGHIDHGKSTLIDYIRKSNVVAKEAGGITQHISAYEIIHPTESGEKKITFLDTPGHEAFSGIRERGANAADIAILVVSGEEGVKPQTLEAATQIKDSNVPYIVAINKMDRPDADLERTKQSLAENNIYVEGYGGDVPFVGISAKTGQGVSDLLETIVLVAELAELKTDPEANGSGVIIESRLDSKRGVIGVGVIKSGVVRRGMFAAATGSIAPLRLILDAASNQVEELSASSPIQIIGWDKLPQAGTEFKTFLKKSDAEEFSHLTRPSSPPSPSPRRGLGEVGVEVTPLPLVIKADAAGSLEAILGEVGKLSRERIYPQIVFAGVGELSEGDIKTAQASSALVFSFHVRIDKRAETLAERSGIEINSFDIIYELIDKVKQLLAEREPRIEIEELVGKAKVLKTFGATKDKQVVGGRVLEGEIKRNAVVKIMRRGTEIGKGKIKELQQSKVATESVAAETEFGAMIETKIEITPGDTVEAFVTVTK